MTIPDLSSRALAARTALLALCDALVSAADASHAGLAVPPPAPAPAPEVCCASPLCPHPPAPEAKRPTHVRVIRRGTNAPAFVTNGAVLKVDEWDAVGDPWIDGWCFCGNREASPSNTIWEPAPCPPPVAGSAELVDPAYAAFREYVEANYKDGVILGNVSWHIPRLWRAAKDALSRPVRP